MQLGINPLILLAWLAGFGALVWGILFVLRILTGSYTSKTSRVAFWYLAALLSYCGVLYAGSQLNPRDRVGGSWTDPYFQVVSIIGFLTCVVMPLRLRIPLIGGIALSAVNLFILLAIFWIWYSTTA